MEFSEVANDAISLRVAIAGNGPLVVCVHGWPELWYSWRHQIEHLAAHGYTVAAMDVRGYGGSSKPYPIAAYTMKELTSDVVAVSRALSSDPVVLLGHDWGAPIVWNTALLYPNDVRAVAGLSVPYLPGGDVMVLDLWEALYRDRFFYQLYFQREGAVEAEVASDYRRALRKIYYSLSGSAPEGDWIKNKPRDAALLDGLINPDPFPDWMSDKDLDVYVEAFEAGGFRGPVNRYRAQPIDFRELEDLRGRHITQPACFIGGAKDAVRRFLPGGDLYADPGASCDDFRGSTIVAGMGHWIQQEAPAATNAALEAFFACL